MYSTPPTVDALSLLAHTVRGYHPTLPRYSQAALQRTAEVGRYIYCLIPRPHHIWVERIWWTTDSSLSFLIEIFRKTFCSSRVPRYNWVRRLHPGMTLSISVLLCSVVKDLSLLLCSVVKDLTLLLCSVVKDPTTKKLSVASHVYKVQAKVSHVQVD